MPDKKMLKELIIKSNYDKTIGNDEKHDKIIQEKKMKEKSSGKEMSRMT